MGSDKKSDTTEQLTHTHIHTHTHTHLYFSLLSYFPNKRVSGEENLELVAFVHAIQVAPNIAIIRIQVLILFYKYIILFMLPTLRHVWWSCNLWIFKDHRSSFFSSMMGTVKRLIVIWKRKDGTQEGIPWGACHCELILSCFFQGSQQCMVLIWLKKNFSILTHEIKNVWI